MKYIKEYKEHGKGYISLEESTAIYNLIDDCLSEINDGNTEFNVYRELVDIDEYDSNKELLGLDLEVSIYVENKEGYDSFDLNDILDPVNNLISQLNGISIELKSIKYMHKRTPDDLLLSWYRISLDPIDNQIKGNIIQPNSINNLITLKLTFN